MLRLRRRARGFTLVELLVVIAIIGVLVTFLIGALWPQKKKAMRAKTGAMLKAIQTALDQYYSEFHDYPPDGYDKEPGWAPNNTKVTGTGNTAQAYGVELPAGSQCYYAGSGSLIYFLCYPITNLYTVGADQGSPDPRNNRANPVGPYLSTLRPEDVTVKNWDADFDFSVRPGTAGYKKAWAVGEIIDAFGFPIHYDKVKESSDTTYFDAARFSGDAGNNSHTDTTYYSSFVTGVATAPENMACPDGAHGGFGSNSGSSGTSGTLKHGDPRGAAEADGCYIDTPTGAKPAPRNVNSYDLWAHADSWGNGRTAITNWKQQ